MSKIHRINGTNFPALAKPGEIVISNTGKIYVKANSGLNWNLISEVNNPNVIEIKADLTTQNLNNVITTGIYFNKSNLNATLANNYPVTSAGLLEVYTSDNNTYQKYTVLSGQPNQNRFYTRGRYMGVWSPWKLNGLTNEQETTLNRFQTYRPTDFATRDYNGIGIGYHIEDYNDLDGDNYPYMTITTSNPDVLTTEPILHQILPLATRDEVSYMGLNKLSRNNTVFESVRTPIAWQNSQYFKDASIVINSIGSVTQSNFVKQIYSEGIGYRMMAGNSTYEKTFITINPQTKELILGEDLTTRIKIHPSSLTTGGTRTLTVNESGIIHFVAGTPILNETDPTVPTHVKNITTTNITNWNNTSNYFYHYQDLRTLNPNSILTQKFRFGFTSWNNNSTGPYADFIHFGGYQDSSGGKQNLILFRKDTFGIRQFQGNSQATTAYTSYVDYWHSGNFNPSNYITKNENAVLIGFSSGNNPLTFTGGDAYPYFRHSDNTYVPLATRKWVQDNYFYKGYNKNNYIGADYVSGGNEKPNSPYFGGGKLKLQMLSKGNIGSSLIESTWCDVLWMSSYTGADVKGSNALILGKQADEIGFVRQNFDSATWGTYRKIWHSGNFNPSSYATLSNPQFNSGRLVIRDNSLENHSDNADNGLVCVNYQGYLSGGTKFRDFTVFDGKSQPVMTLTGSTKTAVFHGKENNYVEIDCTSWSGVNVPVSMLNFYWYNQKHTLGLIRNASSGTKGLGYFVNGWEKVRFDNNSDILFRQAPTSHATGLVWKNLADTQYLAKIGCLTNGDTVNALFMGFGENPWNGNNSLKIYPNRIEYNNKEVLTTLHLPHVNQILLDTTKTNNTNLKSATYGSSYGIVQGADSAYNPTADWYNVLKILHNNSYGYYTELAMPFHHNELYYRRCAGGTVHPWKKIMSQDNLAHNMFPNSTLIPVGDDCKIGDRNVAGCLVLQSASHGVDAGIQFVNVNGTDGVKISSNPTNGFVVNNRITATSFYESSSIKFKTNVRDYEESALDLIDKLRIVQYDRIDTESKNKIGIIAEESPSQFLNEDKTAVDLYNTIFLLAKSVKELQAEVELLKARLND